MNLLSSAKTDTCKVLSFDNETYIPYNKLENIGSCVVIYKSVFENIIQYRNEESNGNNDNNFDLSVEFALANITLKSFSIKKRKNGILAVVLLRNMKFQNEQYSAGSLILFGNNCLRIKENSNLLFYYETDYLPEIYRTIKDRLKYLERALKDIDNFSFTNTFENDNLIGKGSFANVFSTFINSQTIVLKISRIKSEAFSHPYSVDYSSWHEVNILSHVILPIIKNKICPNLPLIYGSKLCPEYFLKIDGKRKKYDCISIMTELANGNLKEWFTKEEKIRSDDEVYSMLFQVLSALYAIQYYGQIMNFDIKKENILYYKVEKGGYWRYIIENKSYLVPNHGFVFILSDFGVSRSMNPLYKVYKTPSEKSFRMGHRYAIVENNKFVPIQATKSKKTEEVFWGDNSVSNGIHFTQNRKTKKIDCGDIQLSEDTKKYLISNNIDPNPCSENFYINSSIIPPFEFYNDTQDVIKMLIGGKRSTQDGNHKPVKLSKEMNEKLSSFKGKTDNMSGRKFSMNPNQVLASSLLKDLFGFYEEKKEENKKHIIETYDMKKTFSIINVN